MYDNPRRLRRPEERVGQLTNADLPPPAAAHADVDAALIAELRARDERAFEQLVDRYYASMLRVATGFVRSREEAEEVIQETWIAVFSGIHRFEGKSTFRTWLFRILVNRARTRARREARTVPFSAIGDPLDAEPAPGDASERVLNRELRAAIAAALQTLPADQRTVVTLRDVEAWTAGEVCDALEISAANQRVLLHRGRVRMRAALLPYLEEGLRDSAS
jgi:RNA polymerase sigma-70 factor (ECF subfamily)